MNTLMNPTIASATPTAFGQAEPTLTLRRRRLAWLLFCLGLVSGVSASSVRAQADESVDAAAVKGDVAYAVRGSEMEPLKEILKLPFEVEVNTNGIFTVADGEERKLLEGQLLRRDGWLLNQDGSIEPVFDHVAAKEGVVIVVREGVATPLTEPMSFPNDMQISPDGWCDYPSGDHARLADGQLFRLDGTPVPAKDTATFKDGTVVVQKDGKLIPLNGPQIMGMNDGTKVHADGLIESPDGATFELQEGQTVFIEGRAARS
jgi:hypothetical protein